MAALGLRKRVVVGVWEAVLASDGLVSSISTAENQLNHALHLHVHMSQLDAITAALEFADNKPVDPILHHNLVQPHR